MRKFQEQQAALQEAKELGKLRREKVSGYFFDISKLSFTGLVVSLLFPLFSDLSNHTIKLVVILGLVLTISSALLANKILK